MTKYEITEKTLHNCSAVGGGFFHGKTVHIITDRFSALSFRQQLETAGKLVSFKLLND